MTHPCKQNIVGPSLVLDRIDARMSMRRFAMADRNREIGPRQARCPLGGSPHRHALPKVNTQPLRPKGFTYPTHGAHNPYGSKRQGASNG